jgi:hydrogenase expression/formation protein HypE
VTMPESSRSARYPVGKLPQRDLIELLAGTIRTPDPRVILGPGLGKDAAVIDFGDRYLVTKTDPITFATDEIGWYVVHINANDVACLGAIPRWFMVTLLLPEGQADRDQVDTIFQQLHGAADDLDVTIVGGHTEITHGITRPIAVGAMMGEVEPEALVRSDGARPGDALILTKRIAVEGTAILTRELRESLTDVFDREFLDRAANFLHDPGISVVEDAAVIAAAGEVHAMHDPTEGGVATGIYEMTRTAGYGAVIEADKLPFFEETQALCMHLDLNPLGIIASGSLLASVDPDDVSPILRALARHNIEASTIGFVQERSDIVLRDGEGQKPMPTFERDEIAKLFETPASEDA